EDTLPIEHGPRVVVDRDPVDLAVVADDGVGEALGEVAFHRAPDVVDRLVEALLREELHPEPGEPGVDGLRRAAEVVGDLVLERFVVNRVNVDRGTGGVLEGLVDGLHAGLRPGVGVVAADAERTAGAGRGRRRGRGRAGRGLARRGRRRG